MIADESNVREVERYLYRVSTTNDSLSSKSKYEICNLRLNIHEAGSWIIKFRGNGQVVLNNCDLVMTADTLNIDAQISFVTLSNFWGTINGHMSFEAGVSRAQGSEEALLLFKAKFFSSSIEGITDDASSKSQAHAVIVPTSLPVKSGWLIKRRDMMHGWKQRYFKIYIGRFEYFADPLDQVPRAIIPLLEAKVSTPVEVRNRVKNRGIFHQIVVDPKYHEKSFKLISLKKGNEGLAEMSDWARAFDVASKPVQSAARLLNRTPSTRPSLQSENGNIGDGLAHDQNGENSNTRVKATISRKVRRVSESIKRSFSGDNIRIILDGPIPHHAISIIGSVVVAILMRFACMPYLGIELEKFGLLTNTAVMLVSIYFGWDIVGRIYQQVHAE